MNCNNDVHESFIETGDIICPFCNSQLTYIEKKTTEI